MTMSLLEYFLISAAGSALIILIGRVVLAAGLGRPADYYAAGEKRIEELFFGMPASASADRSITVSENESEKSEIETCQTHSVETEHDRNKRVESEKFKTIEPAASVPEEKEEKRVERIPETRTESESVDIVHETTAPIQTSDESEPVNDEIIDVTEPEEEQKPIGFAIKAKTSREMPPKKKEEAEPLMTITDEGEKVSGWTESYAEIRESLEKAYDEKVKPSMRLKKQVLINIAEARGIEIPEKATKRVILDLINALEEEESDQA